jgi:hypothetical protein
MHPVLPYLPLAGVPREVEVLGHAEFHALLGFAAPAPAV